MTFVTKQIWEKTGLKFYILDTVLGQLRETRVKQ